MMNHENIIDIWHSNPTEYRRAYVIPDGCQDVIFSFQPNNKPNVYLSPLYQQTIMIEMMPDTQMMGFCLPS
ncbi:hypothetical protein [Aliivibrio kagoshimensis]|uniref:hypothetical protein n=1 Tax=Aliivibrio kagoshimensis TaxID=2910230 RepID=UPI003D126EA2